MSIFILVSIAYDSKKNKISSRCSRGFFSTIELAREAVFNYSDSVSEGGWFNYLLIEERELDVLDGYRTEEEWYQYINTPGENILINKIEKPNIFKHCSNFA